MKQYLIIVLCCLVFLVKTDDVSDARDHFLAMQRECMQESGMVDEMLAKVMGGEFPDDPKLKEQLVCVGKKGGVIDADGNYHIDILKKNALLFLDDEEKVNTIIDSCYVAKATVKETAFEMAKCICMKFKN